MEHRNQKTKNEMVRTPFHSRGKIPHILKQKLCIFTTSLSSFIKTEPLDQFASHFHSFFLKGSSYEKYKKILKIDIIRDHVTKNVTRIKKNVFFKTQYYRF